MCDYCQGEGCACGKTADYNSPCESEIIGPKACTICGCQSRPWWSGLRLPVSESITEYLWDLESDEKFFPATKAKIIKSASQEDIEILETTLPEQTYYNTSEIVAALIKHNPPIKFERRSTDILWKYPAEAVAAGEQLIVTGDQVAVMVSKNGKVCDKFTEGSYTISSSNCPILAQESRKVLPGYSYSILNGSPVFVSPSFEFEIDLTTMGQTRALRRVTARGSARVRVSSPKELVELFGPKSAYNSEQILAALTRYGSEALKKEMMMHELDELSNNPSILGKSLSDSLTKAGLNPVKITFGYVGEVGPAMFMPAQGQMTNDPRSAEQMKQMAESMRAAQMARMQAMQEMMQQRKQQQQSVSAPGTSGSQTVSCPNCNTPNPQGSKFCNNCGNPMQPSKKTCPSCGKLSDQSVKFCGNCGTKL